MQPPNTVVLTQSWPHDTEDLPIKLSYPEKLTYTYLQLKMKTLHFHLVNTGSSTFTNVKTLKGKHECQELHKLLTLNLIL